MPFRRSIIAITVLCALLPAAQAGSDAKNADKGAAAQVAEVRKSFTLNGQIIPPGIFGDFGDNNLADSDSIWVTVDLATAVGSNLISGNTVLVTTTRGGPANDGTRAPLTLTAERP
jgi:hypothetical protein